MTFKIELDEDSISEEEIVHEVARQLSYQLRDKIDFNRIVKEAQEEFKATKDQEIKKVKVEIQEWDKQSIMYDWVDKVIYNKMIEDVTEKVVKKLSFNSNFIANVS